MATRKTPPRSAPESTPNERAEEEQRRVREAYARLGRMGGRATKAKYGPEFYSSIGKHGGESRKDALGHEGYQQLGHKGGEAVKEKYGSEFYSSIGGKGGEARREQMARGEIVRRDPEREL